jgi:hypothetical protein
MALDKSCCAACVTADNALSSLNQAYCISFGAFPALKAHGPAPLTVAIPAVLAEPYAYGTSREDVGLLPVMTKRSLATAGGLWAGAWRRCTCMCDVCTGLSDGVCAYQGGGGGIGWYPWVIKTRPLPKSSLVRAWVCMKLASSAVWTIDATEVEFVPALETAIKAAADVLVNELFVWSERSSWRAAASQGHA